MSYTNRNRMNKFVLFSRHLRGKSKGEKKMIKSQVFFLTRTKKLLIRYLKSNNNYGCSKVCETKWFYRLFNALLYLFTPNYPHSDTHILKNARTHTNQNACCYIELSFSPELFEKKNGIA